MRKKLLSAEQAMEIEGSLLDVIVKADALAKDPSLSDQEKETLAQMQITVQSCLATLGGLPEQSPDMWRSVLQTCLKELIRTLMLHADDIDTHKMTELVQQLLSHL